jgi:hypothetical protein
MHIARQARKTSVSAAHNLMGARRDRETFDYYAINTGATIKIHSSDYIMRLIAIASRVALINLSCYSNRVLPQR